MKKAILTALVIALAQTAFAAPAKEAKVATLAEARTYIDSRNDLKEYKKAAESKKVTEGVKTAAIKFLTDATSNVGGISGSSLEALTATRPETLVKVVQLITEIKNGSVEQKAKATNDLRILSDAGKYEVSKTEAEALEKITEMADYNQQAKDFKSELAKVLKLGKAKTITEAVEMASKGKITLDKIKDCII